MSKLSAEEKFLDLSDYGRPIAVAFASRLKDTSATPVQVTFLFGISGLIAVYCILNGFYVAAGLFLILKSIIDAADGELARIKNTPSYTGRYLDSIFDIILNLMFLLAIWHVTYHSIWAALLAFASIQLQGTLYNYYYVILRHNSTGGDKTSNIFEIENPAALPGEKQKTVDFLFKVYTLFYSVYDKIIYRIDPNAPDTPAFPKWFMTLLSIYGLGFQLLIISVMLAAGLVELVIPFFIMYSIFIVLFIVIRRTLLVEKAAVNV
ncbi:MAG: CDP-alcohol phosphatidyltransferase family protein [Balneolaceae bacterium]|nr:MAG: CDP-alcohol phosphatidyltransferase family protein [Balneolaceae bacterium]